MLKFKNYISIYLFLIFALYSNISLADNHNVFEILAKIQKDIKTLEKAVYANSANTFTSTDDITSNISDQNSEDVLTRHLLKLSEIENQFQKLTNKFEEINFKLDKLSSRLSKVQADNQLRFQGLENRNVNLNNKKIAEPKKKIVKKLPGSSEPQDLGSISYKDSEPTTETQQTQSIETTVTVVTETFQSEEKLLPDSTPEKQYEFASSFLQVGDYNTAEKAFKEFVETNPKHMLAGNAQYWYAETFRIRQLYTDAASAFLEGYQKYPKSEKAPINLLRLGVSMIQIGEKEQGCKMITAVKKTYPKAELSVLQKAKYDAKKFNCKEEKS
jgi:tol-pal system protein YbgF